MKLNKTKICVIGLGYVGLPLSVELSKKFSVVGYDKNQFRVQELLKFNDNTNEIKKKNLKKSKILFSGSPKILKEANFFIITVPTPVNSKNLPDLTSLITASKLVAKNLKKKDTVVYESTVYPGCTEEVLIPVLEKNSGMKLNKDFHVGYSPERIDPGSSKYKLTNQNKIISGSNAIALRLIENIYKKIIRKKIFKAKSIKVAEAAKIIENTQRDINIAFINEISMLFHKLGINTNEVLKAANTKWNF